MDSILYIKSNFERYIMILYKNEEIIFSTCHTFTTKTYSHKSEEVQKSISENIKLLIQACKENNINSFAIEFKGHGPLVTSLLNNELLNAQGISIPSIKDKTPIPHNFCRPPEKEKIKKIKSTIN